MKLKAKEMFSERDYKRIKYVLKLFNGRVVAIRNIEELEAEDRDHGKYDGHDLNWQL